MKRGPDANSDPPPEAECIFSCAGLRRDFRRACFMG
jgi:hypothetical protein